MPDDPHVSPLWPADSPAAIAHLNMLQSIINRLANNSASCKTWCLALVGALLSLAGATHSPGVVTFALVPVVIFGFVDTMYLAQEKAYRDLYQEIVISIRGKSYGLSNVYKASAPLCFCNFCSALASWSVFPVYLGLIAVYLIACGMGWLNLLTVAVK